MKRRLSSLPKFTTLLAICLYLISCSKEPTTQTNDVSFKLTESNIDSLVSVMTLDEKLVMINASSSFTSGGVPRFGIPELVMSDGPHGVRHEHGRDWEKEDTNEDMATYLPTGVTLAATWNPALGYEFGKTLGEEANHRGKDVILGPGVNIIRTPLNGRNFEYLSEDPYLITQLAPGYIKGVQEQGVSACVKHFVANNQEQDRHTINVEMDERTLREIYLPGFKAAILEGNAYTLMGAYNKFRGQFCTHNEYLINKVLKGEWGFKGAVISDWGAVKDTKQAALNGNDIEMGTDLSMMPNPDYNKFFMAEPLKKMIEAGEIDESLVDDKVKRILNVMLWTKLSENRPKGEFNSAPHQETTYKVAEEGIVLLKNDNILPLDESSLQSIAVIGENAKRKQAGGGGSSQIKAKYEITPLEGIQKLVGEGTKISFAQGYFVDKENTDNSKEIEEAVALAKASDIAIVVGGLVHGYTDEWNDNAYDAEFIDKPDMQLPFNQAALIEAVVKANPKTIVVLVSGGPSDMTTWVNNVPGIVQLWYAGMEGGNALANILFGKTNPSGKLPMTFPKKLEDSPAHAIGEYPGSGPDGVVKYNEGIYVGYRYFDSKNVAPQFAFGHGLSYSSFEYSNLAISEEGNTSFKVSFDIENTGSMTGKEVAQLYVADKEASVERPTKELKGFKKIELKAGEKKTVTLTLDESSFSFYDDKTSSWIAEAGAFDILVGASSKDIKLNEMIELK